MLELPLDIAKSYFDNVQVHSWGRLGGGLPNGTPKSSFCRHPTPAALRTKINPVFLTCGSNNAQLKMEIQRQRQRFLLWCHVFFVQKVCTSNKQNLNAALPKPAQNWCTTCAVHACCCTFNLFGFPWGGLLRQTGLRSRPGMEFSRDEFQRNGSVELRLIFNLVWTKGQSDTQLTSELSTTPFQRNNKPLSKRTP